MRIVKTKSETALNETKAAKRIHPEDLSVGDDVAVSEVAFQYPSYLWCGADTTRFPPEQPVRITYLSLSVNEVFRVKSICLPFVLCETAKKEHQVFDVRQLQLVKLDASFAKAVRDAFNDKKSKKKKRKKKNRKK